MSGQTEDRRQFPRLEENLPVRYSKSSKTPADDTYQKAIRQNIGVGGVKLILDEKLEVGTLLAIHLDLPSASGPSPVFATARVAWVEQEPEDRFGVGMEFIDIDEEDRKKILDYVEHTL